MAERRQLSEEQLEKLLTEAGREIVYPPVPNIAPGVERFISRRPPRPEGEPETLPTVEVPPSLNNDYAQPADNPLLLESSKPKSRKRELLALAAALLVFLVVGGALALIFRGLATNGDGAVTNSDVEPGLTNHLYIVSDYYGAEEGFSVYVSGWVRALDPDTGDEIYTIAVDSEADAVLSRDGTRLYVASLFDLIAYDAATGDELWRTKVEDRVRWILGLGPSTIAVSPDGRHLYVYSADVEIIDTEQGDLIGQIDTPNSPNCPAQLHPSPDGRTLYIICLGQGSGRSYAVDLASGEPVPDLSDSDYLRTGYRLAVESPDGALLYAISATRVTVFDMNAREVVAQSNLDLDSSPTYLLRLVAVSPDNERLFIGLATGIDPDSNAESSGEIAVFDTATWQKVDQITTDTLITDQTLAGALDNQSVYASHTDLRPGSSVPIESVLLKLGMDGTVRQILSREREEIRRIFGPPVDTENP